MMSWGAVGGTTNSFVEARASWLWWNKATQYELSEQGWADGLRELVLQRLGAILRGRDEKRLLCGVKWNLLPVTVEG